MHRDHIRRRLKLRQLEILLAVADAGSMAKAAMRLAISQPAISRAVADAEHTLGVPLFDRSTRGVEPTQYGRVLLKRGIAAGELSAGLTPDATLDSLIGPIVYRALTGAKVSRPFVDALIDRVLEPLG